MRRLWSTIATAVLLAGPAAAQQPPQVDPKAAAGRLLDALRSAPSDQDAALIEVHIQEIWDSEGSPAVRLLMARAGRELKARANADAAKDFDAAITLDESQIEAWRGRAQARYAQGDLSGAVADLREAIKREPRDFLAYRMLTEISAQRRDWKAALAAWEKLVGFDPKTAGADKRLKELKSQALGEET